MATFTSQGVECRNGMPGYMVLPNGSERVPGVIVLHERYGFVQHPRNVAERFARLGIAALAINAFFKCDFQDSLAKGTRRYYMSDPESVQYLRAAIEKLHETGQVADAKIAVLGMCQTGRHPLVIGAEDNSIAAAICWYGAGTQKEFEAGPYYPKPLAKIVTRINCPVLGLFGETDRHIPVCNVRRIRDLLEQSGKTFQINVYEDAPHGFLNETMPERYRHPQSETAWHEQMEFLGKAFNGAFGRTRAVQHYSANISADYR